jgi:hypothetical protein
MIHAYATSCPYCYNDIAQSEQSEQKNVSHLLRMDDDRQLEDKAKEGEKSPTAFSQTVYMLFSLATLLAGSVFFFFGVLIKLFSKEGVFTLEWSVGCWPYFVFSALVLITCGLITLSKVEK